MMSKEFEAALLDLQRFLQGKKEQAYFNSVGYSSHWLYHINVGDMVFTLRSANSKDMYQSVRNVVKSHNDKVGVKEGLHISFHNLED